VNNVKAGDPPRVLGPDILGALQMFSEYFQKTKDFLPELLKGKFTQNYF
jgi:hypothetical protein